MSKKITVCDTCGIETDVFTNDGKCRCIDCIFKPLLKEEVIKMSPMVKGKKKEKTKGKTLW